MILTWTQGKHHGLAWDGGAALVDGSVDLSAAIEIWARVVAGVELAGFFTTLSEESGHGLLGLPGFAVVLFGTDGAHLAARGGFAVRAVRGGTTKEVTGAGVSTWSEGRIDSLDTFELVALAASGEPAGPAALRPLIGGVVPAHAIIGGQDQVAPSPRATTHGSGRPVMAPHEHVALRSTDADPVSDVESPHAAVIPRSEPATQVEGMPSESVSDAAADDAAPFGHLWGEHTTAQLVEDAAVRTSAEAPGEPVGGPAVPSRSTSAAHESVETFAPDEQQLGAEYAGDEGDRADSDVGIVSRDADSHASDDPPGANEESEGLITSVPFGRPAPHVTTEPTPAAGDTSEEDHDGMTVLGLDDLASPSTRVSGVVCPSGHANPTHRATCRVCRSPLDGQPQQMDLPVVGVMTTSDGQRIELSGPVRVGRDPRATRFQGDVAPRPLQLPHPHVSANHLEIQVDGWSVLVRDLNSTNGSFLRRHGEPPVRLPETAQILVSDDVIDLGHGVHLTFSELP